MNTTEMQFVDYDYWHYLKHLLIAGRVVNKLGGTTELPLPDYENAMLRGHITLDECFMLGKLLP